MSSDSPIIESVALPPDRRHRSLGAFAALGVVGLAVLATGCGSSTSGVAALGTATTTSGSGGTPQDAAVSYAHCMRSHGVPSFPDPNPQGGFPTFHATVSKQVSRSADDTCRHLLPNGGPGTPAQRRQKLAFALKVARCLRANGYPGFPDPGASGTQIPPGINTSSPRFQLVETRCEQQARQALGLS